MEPLKSLQISLWAQPDGPNTDMKYLGCHGITTVTKPKGTNTLNFCPHPTRPGEYMVSSKTKGPPGLITFTIDSKVYQLFDYLDGLGCSIPIIAQFTEETPRNEFWNWKRSWIFEDADNTEENLDNFSSIGTDNNEVMKHFPMEAGSLTELVNYRVYRDLDITETQALNKIFACDFDLCASPSNAAVSHCDTMYAVGDAVVGSLTNKADLWIYTDGTWTAAAAQPFGTSEAIVTGCCFQLSSTVRRVLVFRGTTDAGAPAECAYTDDGGVTWTTANVGTDNGEFVAGPNSLHVINQGHIWVGTDSGRIYFSDDGGVTWSVQENAGIHSGSWYWVEMLDELIGFAGGAADVLAVTVDGGTTWSQVNATGGGGDILCGSVIDSNGIWVGTDDGELFYTTDQGASWDERTGWDGSGVGDVKDLHFLSVMIGYMAVNNASPKGTFLITRNGGRNWETVSTPTNTGINSLLVCSNRLVVGAGEPQGSKPVVYRMQPALV